MRRTGASRRATSVESISSAMRMARSKPPPTMSVNSSESTRWMVRSGWASMNRLRCGAMCRRPNEVGAEIFSVPVTSEERPEA